MPALARGGWKDHGPGIEGLKDPKAIMVWLINMEEESWSHREPKRASFLSSQRGGPQKGWEELDCPSWVDTRAAKGGVDSSPCSSPSLLGGLSQERHSGRDLVCTWEEVSCSEGTAGDGAWVGSCAG